MPGPWWHWGSKNDRFVSFYSTMSVSRAFLLKSTFDFSTVKEAADIVLQEALSFRAGYFGYDPYSALNSKHCIGAKAAS